jgi:hypothetical protein
LIIYDIKGLKESKEELEYSLKSLVSNYISIAISANKINKINAVTEEEFSVNYLIWSQTI